MSGYVLPKEPPSDLELNDVTQTAAQVLLRMLERDGDDVPEWLREVAAGVDPATTPSDGANDRVELPEHGVDLRDEVDLTDQVDVKEARTLAFRLVTRACVEGRVAWDRAIAWVRSGADPQELRGLNPDEQEALVIPMKVLNRGHQREAFAGILIIVAEVAYGDAAYGDAAQAETLRRRLDDLADLESLAASFRDSPAEGR